MTDAIIFKDKGSKYFKAENFSLALKLYTRGVELLTDSQIDKTVITEEARKTRVILHLNLAAVQLKLNEYSLAIKECQDVSLTLFCILL